MRLQKFLAQYGVGSRRYIESLIVNQQITVNGVIASLGDKVLATDVIAVNGKVISIPVLPTIKTRVLLYHKPLGEICSRNDPLHKVTVFANLPKLAVGRWISIGRLDINTSGLLLFTNNGELANKLMHPRANIIRKYAVRVFKAATAEILQQLTTGVRLADGFAKFATIVAMGGKGINHWYQVTLYEGRNREVRRLWQSQGLQVNKIIRVQFGAIKLPTTLKPGNFIELSAKEIAKL